MALKPVLLVNIGKARKIEIVTEQQFERFLNEGVANPASGKVKSRYWLPLAVPDADDPYLVGGNPREQLFVGRFPNALIARIKADPTHLLF